MTTYEHDLIYFKLVHLKVYQEVCTFVLAPQGVGVYISLEACGQHNNIKV